MLVFYFYLNEILTTVNSISLSGYSQIDVINHFSGRLKEIEDAFISTGVSKKTSLLSWIYYYLHFIFKIEPLNLIYFFKFIEFLLIPVSCNYFLKSLNIKEPVKLSLIYTSIPLLSSVGWNNWAQYGQIFNGEWYNIPHYLFLFSLGFIVREKYRLAIICLLIIFLIHPSKGLALILATSPIILFRIIKKREPDEFVLDILSIGIASLIVAIYSFYILNDSVTKMVNIDWLNITDIHSYHLLLGVFNEKFIIFSFLPILVLGFGIYKRLKSFNLEYIGLNLVIVSIIGKFIDSYIAIPELIKLALHRTSENIILLSVLLVISLPRYDYIKLNFLEIVSVFLLVTQSAEFENFSNLIFIVIIWLIANQLKIDDFKLILFYLVILHNVFDMNLYYYLFIFLLLFSLNYFRNFSFDFIKLKKVWPLLIFMFIGTHVLSIEDKSEMFIVKTNGYYEAQVWANQNTSVESIFFPDPSINYAWRDFSSRNSFGTPREFVTSWLYTQDNEIFQNSLSRSSVFIDNPKEKMETYSFRKYTDLIVESYYSNNPEIYYELCNNFSVDYLLWNKKYSNLPELEKVFESDSHYIFNLNKACT